MHEEKGLEPPEEVLNAPTLFDGGEVYFDAFWALSASRDYFQTGAPKPILLSEISAYFHIHQIDDIDERRDFLDFIRALDRVYLEHEHKRTEREMKKRNKKG